MGIRGGDNVGVLSLACSSRRGYRVLWSPYRGLFAGLSNTCTLVSVTISS